VRAALLGDRPCEAGGPPDWRIPGLRARYLTSLSGERNAAESPTAAMIECGL